MLEALHSQGESSIPCTTPNNDSGCIVARDKLVLGPPPALASQGYLLLAAHCAGWPYIMRCPQTPLMSLAVGGAAALAFLADLAGGAEPALDPMLAMFAQQTEADVEVPTLAEVHNGSV